MTAAGQLTRRTVELDDDVRIHLIEAGSGPPLLLVPGWTCTAEFFSPAIPVLAERHHVVAYDPRGQGRSSKPLSGNNFATRGRDLLRLMDKLKFKKAVLAGWSFGAYDVLAAIEDDGTDRLDALILIDEPPKCMIEDEGQWGEVPLSPDLRTEIVRPIIADREAFWAEYASFMLGETDPAPETVDFIVREGMMTPDTIANAIFLDGIFSDYSEVAAAASNEVPTMVMARPESLATAVRRVREYMPAAQTAEIQTHMAFWTHPEEFARTMLAFVDDAGRS